MRLGSPGPSSTGGTALAARPFDMADECEHPSGTPGRGALYLRPVLSAPWLAAEGQLLRR